VDSRHRNALLAHGSRRVTETDLAGTTKSEYVFFAGEHVARRDGATGTGGVFYYFSDHLKTASVIIDAAGNIKSESDFYPWGGELQFVANDSNHYKFTGKERDSETQLDYFGARHYSNGLGRFVTSDWSAVPVPVPYADLSDPQSFNQYSYVRNIPTVKVDADGHDGGVGTDVEVDMELVKQTLRQLGPEGGVTGTVGLAAIAVVGTAILVHEIAYPSTTVGQSNADEQAAIQQGSQERAAQNGGVDPQAAPAPEPAPASAAPPMKGGGRGGKQERLKELGKDDKVSSADRGEIKRDQNQIARGTRSSIRVPGNKHLAHRRGHAARKGHDYKHSDLQNPDLHRLQHKHEGYK
jgi:RHS repeat-associated protein